MWKLKCLRKLRLHHKKAFWVRSRRTRLFDDSENNGGGLVVGDGVNKWEEEKEKIEVLFLLLKKFYVICYNQQKFVNFDFHQIFELFQSYSLSPNS